MQKVFLKATLYHMLRTCIISRDNIVAQSNRETAYRQEQKGPPIKASSPLVHYRLVSAGEVILEMTVHPMHYLDPVLLE